MGVVSCVSAIRGNLAKSHVESSSFVRLIKKRPLLGGWFSIADFNLVRTTELVCCGEVVRFSEGTLWEAGDCIT